MKSHWEQLTAIAFGITILAGLTPTRPVFATAAVCNAANLQTLADKITSFAVTINSATPAATPVPFCDVKGDITTEVPTPNTVEFELGLPATYNGRLLFLGGGGFNGYIPAGVVDGGVRAQFATAYTDSGHESSFASLAGEEGLSALDGSWGLLPDGGPNTAAQVDLSLIHI